MHERFEIRVWEKIQIIKMRAHELSMTMDLTWGWLELDGMMILVCLLPLHLSPSPPISTLSLVLPCSLSSRERGRWEMGEWVELVAASADDPFFNLVHMTGGTMGKWRTTHSPLTVAVLASGGWFGRLTLLEISTSMMNNFRHWRSQIRHNFSIVTNLW